MGLKKVALLGGCGAMASSCTYDLWKTSDFEEIVIADIDEEKAKKLIQIMGDDKRVSFMKIDATKKEDIKKVMASAPYVVNGLHFGFMSTYIEALKESGDIKCVEVGTGRGLTPISSLLADRGITTYNCNGGLVISSLMAVLGCEEMDEVDEVNFYWGMWRPITHVTPGLAGTAVMEHDPRISSRVYWENGEIISDLPPFAMLHEWDFPEPIGKQETYIIPHTEPITFPQHPIAKEKKVKRVTCRGIFHHGWIRYSKVLLETGIITAKPIEINGVEVSPLEVCQQALVRESKERWDDPRLLAEEIGWEPQAILSAEVIGRKDGQDHAVTYHCQSPYPFFDGKPSTPSMEYGCYVGVPMSITLQMMVNGAFDFGKGAFVTETCGITPRQFFGELEKRGFKISKV